ncbi:hypothetical protein EAH79_11895 [Sphingomonas koreensis]|nr:hypothetical protein EAH79_11895 [Sphingomonas koreensis]
MRTRYVLAGWWAEGTQVVLRDICPLRNEHYANVGGLPIGMAFLGLDNRLLPAVLRDEFDHPDRLDETLAS